MIWPISQTRSGADGARMLFCRKAPIYRAAPRVARPAPKLATPRNACIAWHAMAHKRSATIAASRSKCIDLE